MRVILDEYDLKMRIKMCYENIGGRGDCCGGKVRCIDIEGV
jgi:hypothetical protein